VLFTQFVFFILIVYCGASWFVAFSLVFGTFICQLVNQSLQVVQHSGMNRDADDFRRNSRTVLLGPFNAFLYSNMNFHCEHHMFPGVPYYHLPLLRAELASIGVAMPEAPCGIRAVIKIALDRF
jgi:fatty acid desaturase